MSLVSLIHVQMNQMRIIICFVFLQSIILFVVFKLMFSALLLWIPNKHTLNTSKIKSNQKNHQFLNAIKNVYPKIKKFFLKSFRKSFFQTKTVPLINMHSSFHQFHHQHQHQHLHFYHHHHHHHYYHHHYNYSSEKII